MRTSSALATLVVASLGAGGCNALFDIEDAHVIDLAAAGSSGASGTAGASGSTGGVAGSGGFGTAGVSGGAGDAGVSGSTSTGGSTGGVGGASGSSGQGGDGAGASGMSGSSGQGGAAAGASGASGMSGSSGQGGGGSGPGGMGGMSGSSGQGGAPGCMEGLGDPTGVAPLAIAVTVSLCGSTTEMVPHLTVSAHPNDAPQNMPTMAEVLMDTNVSGFPVTVTLPSLPADIYAVDAFLDYPPYNDLMSPGVEDSMAKPVLGAIVSSTTGASVSLSFVVP